MSTATARQIDASSLGPIVACPATGRRLEFDSATSAFVEPESGNTYPAHNGIALLLAPDERGADLGDALFYEKHSFGFRHWQDWDDVVAGVEHELRGLIDAVPEAGVIFDVGCGEGRISIYASRSGRRVVPIDFTQRAVETVAEHCDAVCVRANNLRMPFQSEVADFLISTGVIHHTPDPLAALRENCRVIKPGGTLYLRTYNRRSYYYPLYAYVGGTFRSLRRRGKVARFMTESVFFGSYRLAFRALKGGDRSPEMIRGKFENYFMKDLVNFATKTGLDDTLGACGFDVVEYRNLGQSHHYLARKRSGEG